MTEIPHGDFIEFVEIYKINHVLSNWYLILVYQLVYDTSLLEVYDATDE